MPKPTKHPLLAALATLAPELAFTVNRSPDPDAIWPSEHLGPNVSNYPAWTYEFRATVILHGELVSASVYVGQVWEHDFDTECGGYLPQQLQEAARSLLKNVNLQAMHRVHLERVIARLQANIKTRCQIQKKAGRPTAITGFPYASPKTTK